MKDKNLSKTSLNLTSDKTLETIRERLRQRRCWRCRIARAVVITVAIGAFLAILEAWL